MADSWRDRQSRTARLARTQESMIPGTVKGRIAQASPVRRQPKDNQDPVDDALVYVNVSEPPEGEAPQGRLWFMLDS